MTSNLLGLKVLIDIDMNYVDNHINTAIHNCILFDKQAKALNNHYDDILIPLP